MPQLSTGSSVLRLALKDSPSGSKAVKQKEEELSDELQDEAIPEITEIDELYAKWLY